MATEQKNNLGYANQQVDATTAPTSQTPSSELDQKADTVVRKNRRTPGLWLYDALLYPILNNTLVFAISVGATYLTTKGGARNADGTLVYGKIGEFFQKRGDWLVKKFKGFGMSDESAGMAKMVFFSFADGTLVAPFVKVLEDRREQFAEKIDHALGTRATDLSVYEAEPKQSWSSVVGGRLATAAIVVPTAVALDKLHLHDRKTDTFLPLNEKFFTNPGIALGEIAKKKGWFKNFAQKHDMHEVAKVTVFEAFYTTVCTAGLYLTSRFFARKQGKHLTPKTPAESNNTTPTSIASANTEQADTAIRHEPKHPERTISSITREDTLAPAPAMALGA